MVQPEVTIEQGTLRGSIGTDIRGDNFYKFQGIPYARPPIGELRFKAPVPPEKWSGVFDATKEGDVCYARDPLKNLQIFGSENCLVLNVFTKNLPDGKTGLRPVLFWIHGGGFVFGNGSEELYGPDFLITEDVVLVTFNYRLGMLGFLSLEDPSLDVPGNAGLKDQVMALKWVQKNIAKFGGDPNNVTIFGESAGGASVHLQVLSPMSKGLFHKAIAQSGCALNPWVQGTPGIEKLAQVMGLSGTDEKTIYRELIQKSVEEIVEIQDKIADVFIASERRAISVVIEKGSKEPFLSDDPVDIMLSGKFNQVPFMIGYTTCEGMVLDLFADRQTEKKEINFSNLIPWLFGYKNETEIQTVAEKIKKFYFGDDAPATQPRKKYDALSDCNFIYGIYVTIMTHLASSKTPIFLYRMSIETELNFFKMILKIDVPGVSHCDDVGYLFKHFATPEIKPGSKEDIALTKFVKLWTNFAKFGNPTPVKDDPLLKATWKPVTGPNLDFLDIGENLVASSNPETERINFWKKLFAESPAGQKVECAYIRK